MEEETCGASTSPALKEILCGSSGYDSLNGIAFKPVALGRKNWLFVGSDEGGETAAVLMSLCTTCKDLGIDPQAYLRDVLDRISTHPARRIEELLPDRWQALRQAGAATND